MITLMNKILFPLSNNCYNTFSRLKWLRKSFFSWHQMCINRNYSVATELLDVKSKAAKSPHLPVMKDEVLEFLQPKGQQVFLDMTFGAGGHSRSLLDVDTDVIVYGLDRDPLAYDYSVQMAKNYEGQLHPLLGRFSELPLLLGRIGVEENSLDGIILDAGCSSMQFDTPERGFSISREGPLDMRMDGNRFPNLPTAGDVINLLDARQLAKIFKTYGEEGKSKKIAQAIIDSRYMMKQLKTTKELAALVATVFHDDYEGVDKLQRYAHPATKVFQALRIFVNNELNELNYAMDVALRYLKPGTGKLAVLTFHSLEDRIVKRHLTGTDVDAPKMYMHKYKNSAKVLSQEELDQVIQPKVWQKVQKHVTKPSDEEVRLNPRSRSAKLRLAIRKNGNDGRSHVLN